MRKKMAKNDIYIYNDSPYKIWFVSCRFVYLLDKYETTERFYKTNFIDNEMEEIRKNKFLKIFEYKKEMDKYIKNRKNPKNKVNRFEIMDI